MADTSILEEILSRRGPQYGHFSVEACLQKTEGRYELVFGKAVAREHGQEKVAQPPLDFGEYVYVSQCYSVTELPPVLQPQAPGFKLGPYEFALKDATLRAFGMGRMPSNNAVSEWPAELLELRPSSHANYVNPKPLVAHNVPRLFHDQYDGMQRFMRIKISYNYNNGWIGAMLIILPDYRLRIREIVGQEQLLTIKTDIKGSFTGARLHCLTEGMQGREEISTEIAESETTVQLKSEIDQLEIVRIFITTANDGVVDSYEQLPTYHTGDTRWLAGARRDDRKDILQEIGKGEGPNLEFKPFIKIGKGEKKETELIRTAIAFANTGGGSILFGVNNLTEIEGIEKDLSPYAPTLEHVAAAELYGRHLRTMLNDAINRRLDLQATVIEIANHILLRLFVAELPAHDKPAWKLATNDIWIRNGSNNHRPDPETIRNLFRSESLIPGVSVQPEEWMS
jgi:hypothetical protein